MTALCERTGSLREAVNQAAELLQVQGDVLPSTEDPVTLCAEFKDGAVVRGETQITGHRGRIAKMWLEPEGLSPAPGLLAAIESADVIVLGPGSLFTSILPNFLIPGVAEAIRDAEALKVMVGNLMTQPGETDDFHASDHLHAIEQYLGEGAIDVCLLNSAEPDSDLLSDAKAFGTFPVYNDDERIRERGVRVIMADLIARDEIYIRHDSMKLGRAVGLITAQPAYCESHNESVPNDREVPACA